MNRKLSGRISLQPKAKETVKFEKGQVVRVVGSDIEQIEGQEGLVMGSPVGFFEEISESDEDAKKIAVALFCGIFIPLPPEQLASCGAEKYLMDICVECGSKVGPFVRRDGKGFYAGCSECFIREGRRHAILGECVKKWNNEDRSLFARCPSCGEGNLAMNEKEWVSSMSCCVCETSFVPADQSPFPAEAARAALSDLVEIMAGVVGDNPDHPQSSQEAWDKFMKGGA